MNHCFMELFRGKKLKIVYGKNHVKETNVSFLYCMLFSSYHVNLSHWWQSAIASRLNFECPNIDIS